MPSYLDDKAYLIFYYTLMNVVMTKVNFFRFRVSVLIRNLAAAAARAGFWPDALRINK